MISLSKFDSLTSYGDLSPSKIVKYIHSELPITLYDTPGFYNDEQIKIKFKGSIINELIGKRKILKLVKKEKKF